MKKIVYSFVTAVAVVAALVSCSHKEIEVVDKTGFEYRFVIAEIDTRAALDNEGVTWEVDDQVGVFLGEQSTSANAPVNAEDTPKTITVTSTAEVSKVYAYYPYNEDNADGAANAEVLFPASQAGGSVSAMPMAGIPTDVTIGGEGGSVNGVIHFVNLGSVIDFRIYSTGDADYSGETVESVTFNAPGKAVSGTATLDLTGVSYDETEKTVTVSEMTMAGGEGSSSATVTQQVVVAASKEAATTPMYLVVAPDTYTGTIVVNTNVASYTFSFTDRQFKRNGLRKYNLNLNNATRVEALTTINLEAATELVAGEKYVLVSNGFALLRDGDNASAAAFDATAMTVTVPTDLQGNIEWTLEKKSGSITRGNEYAFTQGANPDTYYFGIAMNTNPSTYTYTVEVNNGRNVATNISIQDHNISVADGLIYYAGNSSNYYIFYNTTDQMWDNEKVANSSSPAAASKTFLYKLKDMRAEQNPTFSADEAEYDLFKTQWTKAVPTLQNAKGTVTYESSDTDVAQVTSTGAVSIMTTARSGDTAVITAKASGNDEFKPGSASYTISIVNTNPNVTKYQKVTSTADLEPGAKYLLVFEGLEGDTDDGDPKVFSAVLNDGKTQFLKHSSAALDVTIANGVIESDDFDDCQFTLESGYYLKGDKAGKYIYPGTSGSSSVMLAENLSSHALTIAINDGIAEIENGDRYLVWSISSHYFSCNENVSGQYSTGICLYKLVDGLQSQTLTFNYDEFQYDLATSAWTPAEPTLSGAETSPLTWTSFDGAVATVDASGNVTAVAKGTTTIKVTAPANEEYRSGSASFTLTVFDSRVPTYYKVDEIENGKEYIIVSNGYALVLDGTTVSASAVAEGGAEGEVKFEASSNALWTATVSGTSVKVKNGNYYLRTSSNSASFSISNRDSNNAIVYSSENNTVKVGNYYLNCSGTSFTLNNSSDNTSAAFYSTEKPLATQPMAFSGATAEYDLNEDVENHWVEACPTLSGNKTTPITYSIACTPEGVATIDSQTGKVTPLTVGTAIITASVPADNTWKAASASYTLSVIDSSAPSSTYTRISGAAELVTGTYLIVSVNNYNKVLKGGTGDGADRGAVVDATAAPMSMSGNTITISGDDSVCEVYEYVITRTDDSITLRGKLGYLKHDRPSDGGNATTYIGFEDAVSAYSTFVLNTNPGTHISGADAVFFSVQNNTGEYLYYNTSGYYKIGGSGAPSSKKYGGVFLYKKN